MTLPAFSRRRSPSAARSTAAAEPARISTREPSASVSTLLLPSLDRNSCPARYFRPSKDDATTSRRFARQTITDTITSIAATAAVASTAPLSTYGRGRTCDVFFRGRTSRGSNCRRNASYSWSFGSMPLSFRHRLELLAQFCQAISISRSGGFGRNVEGCRYILESQLPPNMHDDNLTLFFR